MFSFLVFVFGISFPLALEQLLSFFYILLHSVPLREWRTQLQTLSMLLIAVFLLYMQEFSVLIDT